MDLISSIQWRDGSARSAGLSLSPAFRLGALLGLCAVIWSPPAQADWPTSSAANLPICTAVGNQGSPRILSDLVGGAFIVWSDNRSTNADIYSQHVLASGTVDSAWPANGLSICAATGSQTNPTIVGDGSGGAIVAWQDPRGGVADIYAQHVLVSGQVDPVWPANGQALCLATGAQLSPVIVSDGAGGAIVAWQDQRAGSGDDIYAQHVLSGGTVDPAWPAGGLAICTATGVQQALRACGDGTGGMLIGWQDARSGAGADDIYAHHVLANGSVDAGWPSDGLLVCGATGAQLSPSIVSDGEAGAILTWYDQRAGTSNSDIYAQHVLASGGVDPAWQGGGIALCTATGNQQFPAITSDGAHGAIVAWVDVRTADANIYAQRVLASGAVDPDWSSDGNAVCVAPNAQSGPAIVSDNAGGAIVEWSDFRSNATICDAYGQHVLANGGVDPAWPLNGAAISTAGGSQVSIRLIPDGSGGAIAAWTDTRAGDTNTDIYAQRVQADGQLGGAVADVAIGSGAAGGLAVWPNPGRGDRFQVRFTLSTSRPATLELLDIAGRRVASRDLTSLGPGPHTIAMDGAGRLAPGIYAVRLAQDHDVSVVRVVEFR